MKPSPTQVAAALEVLVGAGYRITPPVSARLQLMTPLEVGQVLMVSPRRARDYMRQMPGAVRIPGGDLRCRPSDLEAFISHHPIAK